LLHAAPHYTRKWRTVNQCAFFFSSRRRHTRSDRDWSSDVCSSDLIEAFLFVFHVAVTLTANDERILIDLDDHILACETRQIRAEIGRASCRERGWLGVGEGG